MVKCAFDYLAETQVEASNYEKTSKRGGGGVKKTLNT